MDYMPFARAGLSNTEIAELLDVTRHSVGNWLSGSRRPHFLLEERVTTLLDRVNEAVQDGELPLDPSINRKERLNRIKEIIN